MRAVELPKDITVRHPVFTDHNTFDFTVDTDDFDVDAYFGIDEKYFENKALYEAYKKDCRLMFDIEYEPDTKKMTAYYTICGKKTVDMFMMVDWEITEQERDIFLNACNAYARMIEGYESFEDFVQSEIR